MCVIGDWDAGATPPVQRTPNSSAGKAIGGAVALDLLENFPSARPRVAHGTIVHACIDEARSLVAFGEREEGQAGEPTQNVGLLKSHGRASIRLSPGGRPGRAGRISDRNSLRPAQRA